MARPAQHNPGPWLPRGTVTDVTPDNLPMTAIAPIPQEGEVFGITVLSTLGPATHFTVQLYSTSTVAPAVPAPLDERDVLYEWEDWAVADGLFQAIAERQFVSRVYPYAIYLRIIPSGWDWDVFSVVSAPPGAPSDGDTYIIPAAHLVAWQLLPGLGAAKTGDVVVYNAGGVTWIPTTPTANASVYALDEAIFYVFIGGNWGAPGGCDFSYQLEIGEVEE